MTFDFSNTLMEALGIELTHVAKDRVEATMPVDGRTRQPLGYLHGGATAALLETVASVGAVLNIDQATQTAFGVEISVRHRRSACEGIVTGIATPVEIDEQRQLWSVDCYDESGTLLSTGTCAIRVVAR